MQKLGLGDSVIVEKIKASSCSFDVGLDALKQLKEAGVSDSIVQAMIAAMNPNLGGPAATVYGDPNDPNALHKPGIFFCAEVDGKTKMTKIEPSVFTGTKAGFAFFAFYGEQAKARAVLEGKHAELQLPTRRPTFYFYFEKTESGLSDARKDATSPSDFTLAKMEVRDSKNQRRLVIGKIGLYSGTKSSLDKKAVVELTSEKIANGIFKVSPDADLADGEYCFAYTSTTPLVSYGFVTGGAGQVFCFGVQSGEPAPAKRKK